jgi:hypothetical protein
MVCIIWYSKKEIDHLGSVTVVEVWTGIEEKDMVQFGTVLESDSRDVLQV